MKVCLGGEMIDATNYSTLLTFCKPCSVRSDGGKIVKEVNNMKNLYIVKTRMSSPNYILYSEEIDDMTAKFTYKFNKETRQKISTIRSRFNKPIYEGTANFHGLYICQETHRQELEDMVSKANKQFQEIDPMLSASVMFIPLDAGAIRNGEMYDQINLAVKGQIYTDLLERLKKLADSSIKSRSKSSILKMVDRMEKINVLDDPEISLKIYEIREMIENESLIPLLQDLESEVDKIKQRGAFLEM